MKQLLLFATLLIGISKLGAQPYSFSQTEEPYVNIIGGTSINEGSVWGGFDSFRIPIGFSFNYMDRDFTSIQRVEATGRLVFDSNHFYYTDMFAVLGMQDKGISNSLSPISYQLTGNIGNQILKIEFNNATYEDDLGSTINYQIWLYEINGTIELHMGSSTIVNPEAAFPQGRGPFSGVVHLSQFAPTTYIYGLSLYESPLSPSEIIFTGIVSNDRDFFIDTTPPEGMVYRFSKGTTPTTDLNSFDEFSVSPNPAEDQILVKFEASSAKKRVIEIFSSLGQKIETITTTANETRINTTELAIGVYFIKVTNDKKSPFVKKIMKN